jgi:hypothetical protein
MLSDPRSLSIDLLIEASSRTDGLAGTNVGGARWDDNSLINSRTTSFVQSSFALEKMMEILDNTDASTPELTQLACAFISVSEAMLFLESILGLNSFIYCHLAIIRFSLLVYRTVEPP